MNIFILDEDPVVAANLVDKHIIKMPLETAQILCTVAILKGFKAEYRPTHKNHPAIKWASTSSANWNWLCVHGIALSEEYTKRYNKIHKCQRIIQENKDRTVEIFGDNIHYSKHTEFAKCVPEKFKHLDPINAYKKYYIEDKKYIGFWKHPGIMPKWFEDGIKI